MAVVLERADRGAARELTPARWRLHEGAAARLLDAGGRLPLEAWREAGQARVVKHDAHRTVWQVVLESIDVYVKEYRTVGLRGRLRELLRPVKAKSEYERARVLCARGVATPEPLGWGWSGPAWQPTASWLITRTVADARPLTQDLSDRQGQPAARQAMAAALGGFLARLHAAGVIHHDLHPGNLLVRWDHGRPELFLIDLHLARLGPALTWRLRRNNLYVFNRFFLLRCGRSDRLRFWRAYEAAAGHAIPDRPDARPPAMERASWANNVAFWKARERRYCSVNRAFRKVRGAEVAGWAVTDAAALGSGDLQRLLSAPDNLFLTGESLKAGGASTVAAHGPVVAKRFNVRSLGELIKNGFRRSPGWRSWVMGHGLLDAGLPTARPLAFVQRRRWGFPAAGYLLTERLSGMDELHRFADRLPSLPEVERRGVGRARMAAVARVVRQFHERGFGHHDLKAANLLTPADPHDHRVYFIDLVGVHRRYRPESGPPEGVRRLAVSFMHHPAISRSDKLRFLRTYMNWTMRGKCAWKKWWRQISQAAQEKQARNARRGRPLA